mmetsp:Transcript_74896/g.118397  ORF Transcript_74896/g.118397 Transcript_74896/m.118397 type:complete len:651 (-) Transcript_74896:107-2059(-)
MRVLLLFWLCLFFWRATTEDDTEAILSLIKPSISYRLDVEDADADVEDWLKVASAAAQLLPIKCPEDMIGAIDRMLQEAQSGDAVAMAGLGSMFLLGRECEPGRHVSWKPTQNLTWGLHWLNLAAGKGQADAQALLAFAHTTDVLHDIYGYRDFRSDKQQGHRLLQQAADGGSFLATIATAYRHSVGVGVLANREEGVAWYEKAAILSIASLEGELNRSVEQTYPNEIDHLTMLTHLDERVVFDPEYTEHMGKVGDVASLVYIGQLYHKGDHGIPRDRKKAFEIFLKASRMGDGQGHACVGMMLLQDGKYADALKYLRRAAKLNDASGWAGLAYAYLYGAGVPQNDKLAAKCMWKAAKKGHLDAIYNLGVLALQGRGMDQSMRAGVKLLLTAAEFSHTKAQLQYSQLTMHGVRVKKDLDISTLLLKSAAENGDVIRSLMTTALRAHDAKDFKRSLLYYALAAHTGNEVGQHNTAYLYANSKPPLHSQGERMGKQRAMYYFNLAGFQDSNSAAESEVQHGVLLQERGDYLRAAEYFKSAAGSGNDDAMWHLGYLYLHGLGVRKDLGIAWQLFLASGMGSRFAKLRGVERLGFGAARSVYKHRAKLTLGGLLAMMYSNGANPFDFISHLIQSRKPITGMMNEDDVDLFADDF